MSESTRLKWQPHPPGRKILLMVIGRTLQAVTETLYPLCIRQAPPFVPNEVHLITTAEGAQVTRSALLVEDRGWFHLFCQDYARRGIRFTAAQIHVVRNGTGIDLHAAGAMP